MGVKEVGWWWVGEEKEELEGRDHSGENIMVDSDIEQVCRTPCLEETESREGLPGTISLNGGREEGSGYSGRGGGSIYLYILS